MKSYTTCGTSTHETPPSNEKEELLISAANLDESMGNYLWGGGSQSQILLYNSTFQGRGSQS